MSSEPDIISGQGPLDIPTSREISRPVPARKGAQNSKTQQKTYHFVSNSDKTSATAVRNAITSRKYRESKVSRIRELERQLESKAAELELWKERALSAGWIDTAGNLR